MQIHSDGIILAISSANWPLEFGIRGTYKWARNHTYCGLKLTEAFNSKMVFKICEGISCSSSSVKGLVVIVRKNIFLVLPINFLAILYPTSLANLVVELGTRHSHQILLIDQSLNWFIDWLTDWLTDWPTDGLFTPNPLDQSHEPWTSHKITRFQI